MAETIVLRGAYAITDPRLGASGVIPEGAVAITNGIIAETGPFAAMVAKYSGARVLGDGEPQLGAHDKPVLFLHPKDFCGTLIELEQV